MKNLIFLFTFLLGLHAGAEEVTKLEKILGVTVSHGGIEFVVTSGGCTQKHDFSIKKTMGTRSQLVLLRRDVPDTCLALVPYGVRIFFSFDELGIEPGQGFKVGNQLQGTVRYY